MKWKNRSIGHPKSFFELVIAGFSLVALPLIIAFITGAFFVDKLTRQSEESVYRAVQATQNTRVLLRQIAGMERSIRQYFVLGDPLFYESYLSRHEAYEKTAIELEPLLLDLNLKDRLNILNQLEINLYQRLNKSNKSPKSLNVDAQEFIALTEAAQALLRDSNAVIDAEMTMMQNISRQARNIIFWELLAVIPGVIIFIVVFVVLLSRPIRQIDMAIKKIGAGDFDEEVKVTGPRDLEYLGERINWLRTRLKYLEEKKSKFLHYVSHELKTPLTAVRESAELLSEGVTGPLSSHQKEVTDILKKNSIDLQKMIEK
ncbi:MAG: histidine kinase, partial [Gammaproteobacteria bacterium]|nr:histidine kinase [Gammaproteobacteria bacterium]